ncbi:tRNA lysidine(34) synthetase TilS [Periweissella ghanensis]|uniref:tRNA(Ile)-lysidine synthase n=1 Tax=Periweissella ghanensis TaxID=467997 RepID=A0ABM8Z9Y7_9LACO|nr:tRNA lysidine(34) synthetase TilS [Periweissella ghanensis]MCM0600490.1 tRNA lysidine(34) synthetase TilS [Periweissella ghanensis]CAH0418300.1 tRNA(Ile)-lysidine synthase [Periweissella ghanensis]
MKHKLIDIVSQIANNIQTHQLFKVTETLVVAASAGVDSQVLLATLAQLHPSEQVIVVHINHDMRPTAASEAKFVAQQAAQYNFKYEELVWPQSQHPLSGIEAAGRQVRYQYLAAIATKYQATKILTAHHANDLAETFLMKLFRGGRWEQLAGIKWLRPLNGTTDLVRPMLNIPKARLIAYAQQKGLPWCEDESNQDLTYTRNRIRHIILPEILTENPDALNQINQYAAQIKQVETMVAEQVTIYLATIAAQNSWQAIPRTWFQATLKAYLADHLPNVGIKQAQLQQMEKLYFNVKRPHGQVRINQTLVIVKDYHQLAIRNINEQSQPVKQPLAQVITLNKWYLLPNGGKFIVKPNGMDQHNLKISGIIIPLHLEADDWPLRVRYRQSGDQLALKVGHQKLKRLLMDAKVPITQRSTVPLLVNAHDELLWVVDYKARWTNPTQVNYEVTYIPNNKQEILLDDNEQRH